MTGGMALEVGLAVLILLVFVVGLSWRGPDKRQLGVLVAIGLAVLLWMAFRVEPGAVLFGGTFVQDELAIFAKRLFLLATILGVLASLSLRAPTFARRATEYYVAMLASLLGMLVLASARELILLFVAFELMSIPLYVISGFRKREEESIEAALKFFLIGTVSSAFIVYGLSFVYGISRTTDMAGVAAALQDGHPLLILGLVLTLGGLGFKIAAFPFHMWVPDTYEAASTPFVAWLSVAPKAAGFVVMFRLYLEGVGGPVVLWVPVAAGLAAITIVAGNLMAIPQQNVKRLLAYSGIAHIGYMLVGFAAVSADGVAMMLFYLVAYLFGNMGAFFVVEAVAQADGSEAISAYKGLAQRSPVLALCMLLFLLSLGGIPFVAGNLVAIPQQNVKRLLAYSGIAHIGYMLVGFAAVSADGVAMMLFYLVAYLFGNMGAFFVVEAVAQSDGSEAISAYKGLAQRSPVLSLCMLLFLLSLGGIPFVAGFWAKLLVFKAAAQSDQGLYWLVLVGAILTVVALFYYLLVAKRMYIDAPERAQPVPVSPFLALSIFVCAAGVVGVGVYPKPLVMAALRAASGLF